VFLDAGRLLGQGCAARRAGRSSSFTRQGKGGLPPSPDRPLASTAGGLGKMRPGGALQLASGCGPAHAG
jgi:hypothetical protein